MKERTRGTSVGAAGGHGRSLHVPKQWYRDYVSATEAPTPGADVHAYVEA